MNESRKYKYISAGCLLVGLIVGAVGGYSLVDKNLTATIKEATFPFREQGDKYNFINPLLFCEVPGSDILGENKDLSSKIQRLTDDAKNKNIHTSVYYRDLTHGYWVGINEKEKYTPASLMKVVVMIAYLKEARDNPDILEKKIKFSKEIEDLIGEAVSYDRGTELELNQNYSIKDLISRMIIDSDNGATYALISNISEELLDQIYNDLGLEELSGGERLFKISAQNYAFFFRILYNATYLRRTMSEYALSLLSQADYDEGLIAGIDKSIKAAHKYGQAVSTDERGNINNIELHDCGIIYHPERPYLLCIMTSGKNSEELIKVIQDISRAVFNDVKN